MGEDNWCVVIQRYEEASQKNWGGDGRQISMVFGPYTEADAKEFKRVWEAAGRPPGAWAEIWKMAKG